MSSDTQSDSIATVAELRTIVQQFVTERDWERFHNPKSLSMSLAIEAAELMEHFQWLTMEQASSPEAVDRVEVSAELADVLSYLLALANTLNIDLTQALLAKMERNRVKYPIGSPQTAQGKPTPNISET